MTFSGLRPLMLTLVMALGLAAAPAAIAEEQNWVFASIDGGELSLSNWKGRPVLVVNTASRCAFTGQYDGLQDLYDEYRAKGLVVLAVPSQDFRQELATDKDVAEFCQVNFDLDLPMTTISSVKGPNAHPFYKWLAATHGFTPSWNFNKVLIAPDGSVAATFGSSTRPQSRALKKQIEALLSPS